MDLLIITIYFILSNNKNINIIINNLNNNFNSIMGNTAANFCGFKPNCLNSEDKANYVFGTCLDANEREHVQFEDNENVQMSNNLYQTQRTEQNNNEYSKEGRLNMSKRKTIIYYNTL